MSQQWEQEFTKTRIPMIKGFFLSFIGIADSRDAKGFTSTAENIPKCGPENVKRATIPFEEPL